MGKSSREKGKRGERELSSVLSRILGVNARRGQQYSGTEGRDVVGIPGVHIECKRREKLNIRKAMQQAMDDASIEDVPVVCHRCNGGPWLLTVPLDRLDELAVAVAQVIDWSPDDRVALSRENADSSGAGTLDVPPARDSALGA